MDTNEVKYISYKGKRLALYLLRSNYYALDRDIAAFFDVDKGYLLWAASRNKVQSVHRAKIELEKVEWTKLGVYKWPKEKIYGFSLAGIMVIALCINRGDMCRKLTVEFMKESAKLIAKMSSIINYVKFWKEFQNDLNKAIVAHELSRNSLPPKETANFEAQVGVYAKILQDAKSLDDYSKEKLMAIKHFVKDMPPAMRELMFPNCDKV